jgi:hypothetical protein
MENLNKIIREKADYEQLKTDKLRNDSKQRLSKILKKKVETTMIGALSSIEEHFGFLWGASGSPVSSQNLSEEQKIMYEAYQKVRSEILDKGNTQSRNIDAELNQYDVKWLRFTMNIPIKENN